MELPDWLDVYNLLATDAAKELSSENPNLTDREIIELLLIGKDK